MAIRSVATVAPATSTSSTQVRRRTRVHTTDATPTRAAMPATAPNQAAPMSRFFVVSRLPRSLMTTKPIPVSTASMTTATAATTAKSHCHPRPRNLNQRLAPLVWLPVLSRPERYIQDRTQWSIGPPSCTRRVRDLLWAHSWHDARSDLRPSNPLHLDFGVTEPTIHSSLFWECVL